MLYITFIDSYCYNIRYIYVKVKCGDEWEKDVSVGLLGLGVVGSGVIQIIEEHQEELVHQLGCGVKVDKVLVRNMEKARQIEINHDLLTTNPDDVLANSDIDVVVEVMGG